MLPFSLWIVWLNRNDNLFNNIDIDIPVEHTIALATEYALFMEGIKAVKKPITIVYLKW